MVNSVLFRYATIYTMFPVFSLVLDQDVKPEMALLYPELYKDLTKVLCHSLKCVFYHVLKIKVPSSTFSPVNNFQRVSSYVTLMDYVSLFQGRSLSFKTFLIWVLISVYQGKVNRLLVQVIFDYQSLYLLDELASLKITCKFLNSS